VHRVVHVEAAAGRLFEHPGDEDVSELWVAYHSAADAYAYLGVPADAFAAWQRRVRKANTSTA